VGWSVVQEVQLLQSLHHPNIIAMLDSFIEDNELIIVFEWALGGDLKRLIRRQIESGVAMDESLIWGHFTQVHTRRELVLLMRAYCPATFQRGHHLGSTPRADEVMGGSEEGNALRYCVR